MRCFSPSPYRQYFKLSRAGFNPLHLPNVFACLSHKTTAPQGYEHSKHGTNSLQMIPSPFAGQNIYAVLL